METRTADSTVLVHVAAGHLTCTVATRFLKHARRFIVHSLRKSIKKFYMERTFNSLSRLDWPAYLELYSMESASFMNHSWASSIALRTIMISMDITTTVLCLLSQFFVLIITLREKQDGLHLAVLTFLQSISYWHHTRRTVARSLGKSTADVVSIFLSYE
jgi:hypothetical protein